MLAANPACAPPDHRHGATARGVRLNRAPEQLERYRRLYHLPRVKAAATLGIGVTLLKKNVRHHATNRNSRITLDCCWYSRVAGVRVNLVSTKTRVVTTGCSKIKPVDDAQLRVQGVRPVDAKLLNAPWRADAGAGRKHLAVPPDPRDPRREEEPGRGVPGRDGTQCHDRAHAPIHAPTHPLRRGSTNPPAGFPAGTISDLPNTRHRVLAVAGSRSTLYC